MRFLSVVFLLFSGFIFGQQRLENPQAVPPPPPSFHWEYALDYSNTGYATFDITGYLNRFRTMMMSLTPPNNFDLSGYTLHMHANDTPNTDFPITTALFINTVANIQSCRISATYNGSGPNYGNYLHTIGLVSNSLRVLPASGDLDNDGISNQMEDLNQNGLLYDDNTDGDSRWPNFWDPDDDNDGILTINEDYNGNGSPLDDDMNGNGIADYLDNSARGALPLNLKLFIEGYYDGSGMMHPVKFNQDGISPLTDVENITVELHRTTAPYDVVASAAALLKTNGSVTCSFPTASVGSYYIAVKSRNGLETWSAIPQAVSNAATTYDFSSAASKAFGSNMSSLGSGIYGLYSGDINADGIVDPTDYSMWEADSNAFSFGAHITDLNGDGIVDPSDYSIWESSSNNYRFAYKPE